MNSHGIESNVLTVYGKVCRMIDALRRKLKFFRPIKWKCPLNKKFWKRAAI